MNIDWSKALEGATHHYAQTQAVSEHWRKDGFFCNVGFEQDGWQPDRFPMPLSRYTSRQESWTGEGLPPVGTVCEIHQQGVKWVRCEIVAHKHFDCGSNPHAIAWIDGETLDQSQGLRFRPLRTPEQLAAEERERWAEALFDRLYPRFGWENCIGEIQDRYRAEYDRKVTP